ncbi:MAG: hypothetical protein FJ095_18000 [Deltaproteobacteria bacterium]|nr:hypothetical protein [Deltaproteobacteria bacterium]
MKRATVLGWLFVAIAAPTAGDIGSCGQRVAELDPVAFFEAKAAIDCQRCLRCGLFTEACARACEAAPPNEFDDGCYPLVHDGEVCLNALEALSCDAFAATVADAGATVPTECNFCPLAERPLEVSK